MADFGDGGFYGAGELYGGSIWTPNGTAGFNGWAVTLNGVMVVHSCSTQADWDELECSPATVLAALDQVPAGLDLPSLRTEDVTYFQRDGAKHFSDWYTPRMVTIQGTLGPAPTDEDCVTGDCTTVREQLAELVQAWKRTCCDTELVVFTDCYSPDFTDGTNVYPDGTFDVDADGWTGVDGAAVARVTSPIHSGAGSLEIEWGTDPVPYDDPATTGQTGLGATLTGLTPGDVYLVSGWLYAAAGQPMPVLGVKDTTGDGLVYSDPVTADDTWHVVTIDYVVPASGEMVPFVVNGEATTAGDLAYVDEVQAMKYASVNRTVNGPFGIVGRPREFKYNWLSRDDQIVEFVGRFDAVDQRMYVLDECGTPGYTRCVNIQPGSQLLSICMEDGVCFTGAGFCFTNSVAESGGSVDPTEISVGGTEKVYPTITLYPGLASPTIENITTGEYIQYDGDIDTLPITINTEDGTAFDAEGNSMTHLLRGSLFLSLDPGNYEWRLLASGEDVEDPGYATACWRPTVVSA